MRKEEYKKIIVEAIQKIDNIGFLIKIYTVVKYLTS